MNIVNRRNAVVGFLALQALKRARRNATVGYLAAQGVEHTRARRRRGRVLRVVLLVVLGIVSLGVLAGAAGFAVKRRQSAAGRLEEAGAEASATDEAVAAVGDDGVPAGAEPIPTT